MNKVRVEVTGEQDQAAGKTLSLGALFGAVEAEKETLGVREYSIAHTSLEQIFNQLARQVGL